MYPTSHKHVISLALALTLSGCYIPEIPGLDSTGPNGPPIEVNPTEPSGGAPSPKPTPSPSAQPSAIPSSLPSSRPSATPTAIPTLAPSPTPAPTTTPSAPTTACKPNDPSQICIALKLVSYTDPSGKPTVDEFDSTGLVEKISEVWSPCHIAFQLERYEAIDPTKYGLSYGPASEKQLYSIRSEFAEAASMLVVVTGPWSGRTIAWTQMPGAGPYGSVIEEQYGHNALTVGHELGHYQGLYHIKDYANLMNPYIGTDTAGLSASQCQIARETDLADWKEMLR